METQVFENNVRPGDSRGPATSPPRLRVLLVEDDPDMRRLVAAVLARDNCEVVQARDGISLLRRIESELWSEKPERFDVIVSDIQMPDLSALEVLEALRYRDVNTPVVLITAYGNARWRDEAHALGVATVLEKPLDWQAFRAAIRNAATA